MGQPEQQITSRLLKRQEAIIGTLMMCLSTLSAQFLIQNIYAWQISEETLECLIQNIYSQRQWPVSERTGALSFLVIAFEAVLWVVGLIIYFQAFENKGQRDRAARNKGLMYGLGAVNICLVMIIICPRINERISFAIKVLPAYMGIVIGNLQLTIRMKCNILWETKDDHP